MTGTPSWEVELIEFSVFLAGTSTYWCWAGGFNAIFSSSLLLHSIELAADLWGYLEAWHWKRKMLVGEERCNEAPHTWLLVRPVADKDVFLICIAHPTKSYSGIPLQCFQIFVWVGFIFNYKTAPFCSSLLTGFVGMLWSFIFNHLLCSWSLW